MSSIRIEPIECLKGSINLPGDKSISQRAIIISSIAQGKTIISNILIGDDCLCLISAFRKMGVKIKYITKEKDIAKIQIEGVGLYGLSGSRDVLYLGNSGTAARLLSGLLSAQRFDSKIEGDVSLSSRPMKRVIIPLRMMGAFISGRKQGGDEYLPLLIHTSPFLKPIKYTMPVPSAQVKSAIMLAGIYINPVRNLKQDESSCFSQGISNGVKGSTVVYEPLLSRDHTERMLKTFGADIEVKRKLKEIIIYGGKELRSPGLISIPSDISSASYFIVGATILKGSKVIIKSVGTNPTRLGIITALRRMGANITMVKREQRLKNYEPTADIVAAYSNLKGIIIKSDEIPFLIDEIPLLMVAACFAKGKTVIKGVEELRIKETDRIKSMIENLNKMNAEIKVIKDGKRENLIIHGKKKLKGNIFDSFGDHRTAMSMAIAALGAEGSSIIKNTKCIKKSFPTFLSTLKSLIKQ